MISFELMECSLYGPVQEGESWTWSQKGRSSKDKVQAHGEDQSIYANLVIPVVMYFIP